MDATQFQQVAKALAEPRRLEILAAIATHDELSCREIVEQFPVSQATVSHHIKELVKVGLIETRRAGQYCHYSFRAEVLADYMTQLQQLLTTNVRSKSPELI